MKKFVSALVSVTTALSVLVIPLISQAATSVISPTTLGSWVIDNVDCNFDFSVCTPTGSLPTPGGATTDFVSGPLTPPAGAGSLHEVVGTDGNDAARIKTGAYNGMLLSDITTLAYSTYVTSNNGGQAPYLQLRIDLDGNGTTDDALFFEPAYQNGGYSTLPYSTAVPDQCGGNPLCVSLGAWQTWDAAAGGWWSNVDSAGGPPLTTMAGYEANYPGAKLATDADALRITSGFGAGAWDNFDGNADNLILNSDIYDFELTPPGPPACTFTTVGTTMTLDGDCTTDATILVPDGFTLDGANYTITAVDPAVGHFLGAIIKNGGTSANVQNLKLTTSSLADVCDGGNGRLRGILFDGASGSITNNTVTNINQGASGCQEGNGIEARNTPFSTAGPDVAVTISGNTVANYQKNGITANGSVSATITNNTVTGAGAINYIAQNGVQIGFGGTATVKSNSISGNNYTPADTVACGLLMFEADGVGQSKNIFSANERDVCNFGRGGGKVKASD